MNFFEENTNVGLVLGKCMESIQKVNNAIKYLPNQYQNCNTNQILILGELCHKVRKPWPTQTIIWVVEEVYLNSVKILG